MLKSMTGYGSAEGEVGGRRLFVEMKAVNHRYFAFQAKLPNSLNAIEGAVQTLAKERLTRGQLSVFAAWDRKGQGGGQSFSINFEAAKNAATQLKALKEALGLAGEVELSHLLALPEVMGQEEANLGDEKVRDEALKLFDEALRMMEKFRSREGEDLFKDITERLKAFDALAAKIEERRPAIVAEQKARLEKRIADLAGDKVADAAIAERVALEIAMFADRCDVSEELVRLKSHSAKLLELVREKGPAGRKLDFLLQEFNRETNTIGSKSPDAETSRIVVEMKAELEKMREQVQNIE